MKPVPGGAPHSEPMSSHPRKLQPGSVVDDSPTESSVAAVLVDEVEVEVDVEVEVVEVEVVEVEVVEVVEVVAPLPAVLPPAHARRRLRTRTPRRRG